MSTSKIGRAIKTRDVVSPGFSDNKKKNSIGLKEDLDNLLELYNDLESLYKEQNEKLDNLSDAIIKLQLTNSGKQIVILKLEEELKEKNSILSNINITLSTMESKIRLLEANFESVKKSLEDNDKDKKSNKWNLFKS